ncbi:PPE family protein [Mycobacterium decipiens]|nr:PPE family protein [Mycobacterium decipiens]
MHFEANPPEVNSGNMYAGPGPDSLWAAASAWRSLDTEMTAVQRMFNRTLLCLMDAWQGPAATQVMEATKPFVRWLAELCEQLSEVEMQIYQIERAYEWARREVVHPTQIYRNRAEKWLLINNNVLGQNNAAIADLDQEYDDFWDEDGEVMRDYRLRVSDALAQLTPWKPPPPIANKTGLVAPAPLSTVLSRTGA